MIDVSFFTIDFAKATKNGDFPPEYVYGKIKKKWNADEKKYSDEVECIFLETFFYALKKSKISIILPPDALSEQKIHELNELAEAGKDISLDFANLKIGLKSGFNGTVDIRATADAVTVQ